MKRKPKHNKALWYQIKPPPIKKGDGYEYQARKFLKDKFCDYPGCFRKATQVHHVRGRAGKLKMNQKYWLAMCWNHHHKIHNNMDQARKIGMIAQRGDWGRQD